MISPPRAIRFEVRPRDRQDTLVRVVRQTKATSLWRTRPSLTCPSERARPALHNRRPQKALEGVPSLHQGFRFSRAIKKRCVRDYLTSIITSPPRTLAPPTCIIIPQEPRNINNNNRLTPENEAFAEPVTHHPAGSQKGPAPPPPRAIIQFHIHSESEGSAESETRTLSPLHTAGLSAPRYKKPRDQTSQPAWPLRPSARLLA